MDPLEDTRRWLQRAVIGLNLCPFAKAVVNKGQVRMVLSGARDEAALLAHCAGLLARYKLPRSLVIGPLPRTATGKVQRAELRKAGTHGAWRRAGTRVSHDNHPGENNEP